MSTCIGCGTPPVPAICTPGVTDTPVFFRPAGAHAPVPGFIRVTVLADCTQTVQHLDDALVAYGSLQPLVEVPYVSALGVTGGGGGGPNTTIADGADVAQGATTAAAAPADGTGNYSLVAAAKRSLLNMAAMLTNWTTLLARVPTLGQKAATGSVPVILASDQGPVAAIGFAAIPTQSFTRPADTTAYTAGDLIANSTTAGSVTPVAINVARVAAGSFLINRVRLSKSGTGVTGASFRVHLFNVAPTVANGDNGVLLTSGRAGYIGRVDIDMSAGTIFNDGCAATADAGFLVALASGQTVWALIEARAAYAPASGETFALTLEVAQN